MKRQHWKCYKLLRTLTHQFVIRRNVYEPVKSGYKYSKSSALLDGVVRLFEHVTTMLDEMLIKMSIRMERFQRCVKRKYISAYREG